MSSKPTTLVMTIGKASGYHGGYEFILYRGDELVARQKFFPTYAKAKAAALLMAEKIEQESSE